MFVHIQNARRHMAFHAFLTTERLDRIMYAALVGQGLKLLLVPHLYLLTQSF